MKKGARQRAAAHGPANPNERPPASSVSELLMRHAGQGEDGPIDPTALEAMAAETPTRTINAALAALRRQDLLHQQIATVERALAANPRSVELLLTLAKLHRHLDAPQAALAAYRRVIEVDPNRKDVQHMIAALGGGSEPAPPRAGDAYVAEEFDDFAARYDEVLVGWLGYRGPEVIRRAVDAVLGEHPSRQDIVDLGCGTGLAAPLFRPLARRLDGVDLSPKMIERARQRGLYDDLAVDEIGRFLAATPRRYTFALAADVLIYFGELEPIFGAVFAVLRSGGIFAFTLEAGEGADYRLTPTGRYVHEDAYVRAAAQSAGFDIARATDETIRKERSRPVASRCYILRRPSASAMAET